jgi:hypothetical protein
MRTLVIVALIGALMTTGCAGHYAATMTPAPKPAPGQAGTRLLADYVAALPVGSRVRVDLSDGTVVKGILMAVENVAIVVQRRSRIPEAPRQIPLGSVERVEIDEGSSVGRTIAIGAGAGAAAAFGVFMLILAVLSD